MKISPITSFKPNNNPKFNCIQKAKTVSNVPFGSINLPENGWTALSFIADYNAFRDIWSVPPAIMLGLLHNNNIHVYSENKKPLIVFSDQKEKGLHCLFGNGTKNPYVWVSIKKNPIESINSLLKNEACRTTTYEKGQSTDGIVLFDDDCCTVCYKTPLWYSSSKDRRSPIIPSRYLKVLKNRLEEMKFNK